MEEIRLSTHSNHRSLGTSLDTKQANRLEGQEERKKQIFQSVLGKKPCLDFETTSTNYLICMSALAPDRPKQRKNSSTAPDELGWSRAFAKRHQYIFVVR